MKTENRGFFDWVTFLLIHIIVIGGISVAGFYIYGLRLGVWVAASATVAGLSAMYLFAREVPNETPMKCMLYLCVALNALYLIDNGARNIGIEAYNRAQVEKYEKGMAEAGKSGSRRIARELALSAKSATALEKVFSDGVALTAAILAFLEIGMALIVFAISSKRLAREEASQVARLRNTQPTVEEIEEYLAGLDVRPTGRLEGKGPRR